MQCRDCEIIDMESPKKFLLEPLVNEIAADGSAYHREMIHFSPVRRPSSEIHLYLQHFSRHIRNPETGCEILVTLALIQTPAISNQVLLREQFWHCIAPTNKIGVPESVTRGYCRIQAMPVATAEEKQVRAGDANTANRDSELAARSQQPMREMSQASRCFISNEDRL